MIANRRNSISLSGGLIIALAIGISALLGWQGATAGESEAKTHDFVGAKKCKMCHKKKSAGEQFKVWTESKHAEAFNLLASDEAKKVAAELGIDDAQKSGKCLKCHSTAYNHTETLATNISVSKKTGDPLLVVAEGVSCESCHWSGADYKKKKTMKNHDLSVSKGMNPEPKEACVKCHNDENPTWDAKKYTLKDGSTSGFDFDQAWEEIAHMRPEAEAAK